MSDFPSVDTYTDLNLSSGSEAVSALNDSDAIDQEARAGEIRLTDLVGAEPASLTPHARNWYSMYIGGTRRAALDEINRAMQNIGQKTGVGARLLERELDEIDDQVIVEKRAAKKNHLEQNVGRHEQMDEVKTAYIQSKTQYDRKRMQRGREPIIPGFLYFGMIVFIGIFEAFINFEAFSALAFMTPAVALGSTVVIAVLLAMSSHLHGKFLKEIQYRFGDQNKDGDRGAALRMFSIATLGLSIVLGAVWYARANYLSDIILETSVIGGTPPSWLATVGGSLLLNLGVWVAGVILSFQMHDPDPDFPDSYKSYQKHKDDYRSRQQKLDGELETVYKRINAKAEMDRENALTFSQSMERDTDFQIVRKQFDRMTSQDAKVLGLLRTYQAKLGSLANKNDLQLTRKDDVGSDMTEDLTPADYSSLALKLKYI